MLDVVVRHRRIYLDGLIADWDEADREIFARLLTRFAKAAVAHPADLVNLDQMIAEAVEGTSEPTTPR